MAIDRDKLLQSAAKLVEKKRYDKAVLEYQKVVQHDPKDARTLLKLGDLYSRLKDFASAVATYDRVATLYAAQGFHLKAIAVFKQIREIIAKQAPELSARYSHITPRLADIYAELNLVTDALAAYDEVATNFQRAGRDHDAIAVFQKTVQLDPKNPLPHLRLAEARCRVRALDEAIDSFWTAAELLLGLRRPEDALKVIERILQFRPEAIYARAAAELYLRKGDPESGMLALSRLQLAFQANPKDLDTLALLAQAFEVIEQPEKALAVHLEMARLAREQKRADLWHQIMAHLRQVAPHNDQLHALDRAGPPAVTLAPGGPPSVEVHVLDDEEAIDLDEEVEYLEEVASLRTAQRISQLPHTSHPPTSIARPSRPPSVTSPSLRGELMDAVDDDDEGIPIGESLRGDVQERGLPQPQSFQPSNHAHKAIA
ncbi:MAG TPA: tetratricopeptide repeat protein, partial [Polyangiaceae bacterium]|nr:tetratricopeptide repeat protein [Polyangiaceae bacterium]